MTKRKFDFYKNSKAEWYLALPEWDGDPEDLQMVEGGDKWLDLISNHASKLSVWMSDESFEGASILTLLHIREQNLGGGGSYYLETYKNQKIELKIWFCNVTEFVFGAYPQRLYFAL